MHPVAATPAACVRPFLLAACQLSSQATSLAHRPDTSRVYVDVGLGFHAEMTIDEAVSFASKREAVHNSSANALTQQAAQLKAKIKLVIGAIDELVKSQGVES